MPNCRECKYASIRLKCLACEQADELEKEKHKPHQYPQVITPAEELPFPQLDPRERAVWILHLSNFTEEEIAQFTYISQPAISLCLSKIKIKLEG